MLNFSSSGFYGLGLLFLLSLHGTAAASSSIEDYLLMNVCTRADGTVTGESPLSCPLSRQRDVRADDTLSYVHSDYPAQNKTEGCLGLGFSRRYSFPLSTKATDGSGSQYPLIVGWTDYPPRQTPCNYGQFDSRDTLTLLTVARGFASLVGAYHHNHWFLTLGAGYLDPHQLGVRRFLGTWSFPSTVPPLGEVGWSIFDRRTMSFSTDNFSGTVFPPHDPSGHLRPTFQIWKHMTFTFGSLNHPTRPMDTLLHIPFTEVAETGDAPGASKGSEHLYLTRELGYVTRWESWGRDDNTKDVIGLAKKTYAQATCTKPATIEGQLTPHLWIGPVLDDEDSHVFKQEVLTIDQAGHRESHWWYMTGCHDFTNIHLVSPYRLSNLVNEKTFGLPFIDQFQSPPPGQPSP